MKKFFKRLRPWFFALAASLSYALLPRVASAHEAYVLSPQEFQASLKTVSFDALNALKDPGNQRTFLLITAVVIVVFALNLIFRLSRPGQKFHRALEKLNRFGPFIVRLAIAASFFFSALSWSFLGPELPLINLQLAGALRIILFVLSGMLLLGLFTEVAALISLILYGIAAHFYGWYIATYLNYFGEIIALFLFGSRYLSLDELIFGSLKRFPRFREFQTTIVRVCYGIALTYAAITIKFLHPVLTVTVVEKYNLTQFHWLFPHDPLLVTLGAAVAESLIGIFIIFGFELRLTVLISLFYITLSLIYFRELVWPHLMLYGISLNLLFEPEKFTLDGSLSKKISMGGGER